MAENTTRTFPATTPFDESLLSEAALFGADTFFDEPDHPSTLELPYPNAIERGWTPLPLEGIPGAEDGVQTFDLLPLVPADFPVPLTELDSAAHFYTGELEGKETLAIAFRSTDDGPGEYAFQGLDLRDVPDPFGANWGWDIYHALHASAVTAALSHAADETNGIEQILITGHSLGGVLAELATARILQNDFADLQDKAITVTFGSPGSTEDASGANIFNVINSDDLVARLSDLSPVFQENGAAREGVTLPVDRFEGELPDFAPEDLDTVPEVFAATQVEANRAEHQIDFYIDDARALTEAERATPGVAEALDDPFRWLGADVERAVNGDDGKDVLVRGGGAQLLLGRAGNDLLSAGKGDDGLAGSLGNDWLHGGKGDDRFDGGAGNDRAFGWRGDDQFLVSAGHDRIYGGPGEDTAIFPGARDDFDLDVGRHKVEADGEGVRAELWQVERLAFTDGTYALEDGELVPLPDATPDASATDFIF